MMRRLLLKLRRRRRLHAELEEELAFHRDQSRLHGNPIALGHTVRVTEDALDLWRFTTIENLWRDLRYGSRSLLRSPALVLSAIVSLGLGIGVNTTMFSLAVELLLSRPSVSGPESIVHVRLAGNSHINRQAFEMVRGAGIFRDLAGEHEEALVNWDDGRETRRVFSIKVTKNYFTALGIPVAHGRGILPADPDQVVVLGHAFWRTRFNADPSVVGRTMRLEGQPYTIVGILRRDHRTLVGFGLSPDLYVPVRPADTMLAMYGRLGAGASLSAVRDHVKAVAMRIDSTHPEAFKYAEDISIDPVAGVPRLKGALITISLFFVLLLAVVGLVLLMACVNVAGLLLARASVRRREMAIRLAIGASRGRLMQQLLVESLLLALLGAGAGLAAAWATGTLVSRLRLTVPVPLQLHVNVDWRVTLYAAALTIAAAVATGLAPTWQAVREAIAPELTRGHRLRLRRVLIGGQIAISMVVLATAVLFLRNLLASNSISPGFDVRHTLRAEVNLPAGGYAGPNEIQAYVERTLPMLRALPGITGAAAARIVPFTGQTNFTAGLTFPDTRDTVVARFNWNAVTPDYFGVLAIPVLQGRTFTESTPAGERAVIVNRAFVQKYLGRRAPIGAVFLWDPLHVRPVEGRDGRQRYRIVGVVANTKNMTIGEADRPQLYQPLAQIENDQRNLQFVLRAATPPALLVDPVRRALRRDDPDVGTEVATLYSSIGLAFLPSQLGAALMGSAGLLALVLAAVGLYGTLAYSVARRVPEIGVRMALGASRRSVIGLVLGEALQLVGVGSAVGLALALLATRPLRLFLVEGLAPTDLVTFVLVLLALTATALVAAWGPARRAARVDPMSALRCE